MIMFKTNLSKRILSFLAVISLVLTLTSCRFDNSVSLPITPGDFSLSAVESYSSEPYIEVNGNIPYFTQDELTTESFESYSPRDILGRCGTAFACVGVDLMPTKERESISSVKPAGWRISKYDFIDGKYLYNRCHLIAYQLTGENANEENLITGTRYLNVDGMLTFEEKVGNYVRETNNHVMYRVTPIFSGNELIARGVLMEAYSVEDSGAGICFCIYAYNVQPNVWINYTDGDNHLSDTSDITVESSHGTTTYILNVNTKKYHLPTCSSVEEMSEKNKDTYTGDESSLIAKGYSPCSICTP